MGKHPKKSFWNGGSVNWGGKSINVGVEGGALARGAQSEFLFKVFAGKLFGKMVINFTNGS